MVTRIDDRWLWLGASVTLFLMAHGIRYAIRDILRLTEIPDDWDSNVEVKQENIENSALHMKSLGCPSGVDFNFKGIPIATLKTLYSSPNFNISDAATALIMTRYRQSPETRKSIERDAVSADEDVAFRAKRTLSFIRDWEVLRDREIASAIPTPAGSDDGTLDDRNGAGSAAAFAGWDAVPRPPQADHTSQDLEARRRRRNAWIHHEAEDGSLVEDDIIQPA
ncbi:hypothetical protein B0A48_13835 [Cryoendolithus antarcticus]|uniref:Uncharacterized protein n=1 Tax=Cryoendolithus antarcticus TaxID=1507870 RepID=A0A1V8SMU6_9PEZI|nr:hypothetical protein B0A48_13835 [Cryoendolithus antarcticus]